MNTISSSLAAPLFLLAGCATHAGVQDQGPGPSPPAKVVGPSAGPFRIHAGAATISPSVFKRDATDRPKLVTRSETSFYTEFDYINRTALRGRVPKHMTDPDLDVRLGFIGDSESLDSQEAAKGDFFAEFAVAPAHIYWHDPPTYTNGDLVYVDTLSVELGVRRVTEKNGFRSSGYYFFGPSYTALLPIDTPKLANGAPTIRAATLHAGAFVSAYNFPSADVDKYAYTDDNEPRYNNLLAFIMRLEMTYPLTDSMDLLMQVHLAQPINSDAPEDWSIFVGATLPLGRIIESFLGSPK